MTIQATHTPADDYTMLQWHEPFCCLVRAMIVRAHRDSIGQVGIEHASRGDKRFLIVKDAQAFMAGPGFRHYCELLGANPDDMLRLIEERERGN